MISCMYGAPMYCLTPLKSILIIAALNILSFLDLTCYRCLQYIEWCTINELQAKLPLHRCLENYPKIIKGTKDCGNTILDEGQ